MIFGFSFTLLFVVLAILCEHKRRILKKDDEVHLRLNGRWSRVKRRYGFRPWKRYLDWRNGRNAFATAAIGALVLTFAL